MLEYEKGWFAERSRVYKELSERENLFKKLDSTFFYFSSPDAGWIDMEMYLNGKKRFACPCSCVYDPFPDMKRWLEDIVRSCNMETTMHIDCEGEEMYLHYEKLRDEVFCISTKDSWRHSKTEKYSEIGLFYVYDSSSDSIPLYALCETKDFINSIYLALLALCGNCYNTHFSDFANEWYYDENNLSHGRKYDNMTFYNAIKSSLIEWKICTKNSYWWDSVRFRRMPKIKETISMWCEFGDALFWGRGIDGKGGCCGNAESLYTDTTGEIKLDSIVGLREWYDEWDSASLPDNWTKRQRRDWDKRGYLFALQVRKLLPDTIDLYYYDWYPKKKVVREKIEYKERYPMIVFNEKCLANIKK